MEGGKVVDAVDVEQAMALAALITRALCDRRAESVPATFGRFAGPLRGAGS
jgi:hypothetical protein